MTLSCTYSTNSNNLLIIEYLNSLEMFSTELKCIVNFKFKPFRLKHVNAIYILENRSHVS